MCFQIQAISLNCHLTLKAYLAFLSSNFSFSTIYLFYQPNMYSMALPTIPLLLVGVLVPGTTLLSSCASL